MNNIYELYKLYKYIISYNYNMNLFICTFLKKLIFLN